MRDPRLRVNDLHVSFSTPAGRLHAVRGVDLEVEAGEAVGIVGESGCGKTTVARCIAGLISADSGRIELDGRALATKRSRPQRRAIQMVFQDPYASLNPRRTVRSVLSELLELHNLASGAAVERRCAELMDLVGLSADALDRLPNAFSGGQRQRLAVARALAVEPRILVADEPTSALDVSVQATVLALFAELRERLGLAIVLISHNLAAVRHLCDRVTVMYLGSVVEAGPTEAIFDDPRHPYTRALNAAAPRLRRVVVPRARLAGEPPSPLDLPSGCSFHPRCPRAETICQTVPPELARINGRSGRAACHFRDEEPAERVA